MATHLTNFKTRSFIKIFGMIGRQGLDILKVFLNQFRIKHDTKLDKIHDFSSNTSQHGFSRTTATLV